MMMMMPSSAITGNRVNSEWYMQLQVCERGCTTPALVPFVLLDFWLYVALEGFEHSRYKLDPGWQCQNITQVPQMPPVQDLTSQRMSSSLNAHSESDPALDPNYPIQLI